MLPAAPPPGSLFSQMTSPDVAQLGVPAPLACALGEADAPSAGRNASAAAQASAVLLISSRARSLDSCMVRADLVFGSSAASRGRDRSGVLGLFDPSSPRPRTDNAIARIAQVDV